MKKTALGAMLASAMILAACNQSGGGNTSGGNAAAPASNGSAAAPAPSEGNASGETADATNQNFTIRNNTGQAINEVYVSAVSSDNWEEDVLGTDTLPNGEAVTITFQRSETQCNWDLRVVLEGGQAVEERNVNLCQTAEIEIAP